MSASFAAPTSLAGGTIRRPIRSLLAPNPRPISRDEAHALVERAIGASRADAIRVTLDSGYSTNIRFAANTVTTAGAIEDASLTVMSSFGARHAAVSTNDLSPGGVAQAVANSERLARLAPEDPEAMPELEPQVYRSSEAFFPSVADLTAEARAAGALDVLRIARAAADLVAAGFLITQSRATAIGNSRGLFGYHPYTNANFTLTVRTADGTGSGWTGAESNDWTGIDFEQLAHRAVDKARASRNPVAIEPGRYTVIMEPQAVGDLVTLIAFYADARSADEGRSPFVKPGGGNRMGERIIDPRLSLVSDPSDPQLRAQPFDGDGLPLGRQVWIENGVLRQLYYSRFWARKQGKTATGAPTSIKLTGGNSSVDEMIRSTDRGILVTRLWYLREVDPRTILYTGLTRDGTFLVENGRVTRSIKNFRFNDSPLFMLNNVEALGAPVRVAGTEAGGPVAVPAVKARDFTFTSLSDAV